jgi:LacI family transcriptional regulator
VSELHHVRSLYSSRVTGIVLIPGVDMLRETRKLLAAVPHVQLVRENAALGSDYG